MSFVFWAWIIVAVVCALGESVAGGFYSLPWAIGAAAAAILEVMHVSHGWQWTALVGVSSVIFVVGQRLIASKRGR